MIAFGCMHSLLFTYESEDQAKRGSLGFPTSSLFPRFLDTSSLFLPSSPGPSISCAPMALSLHDARQIVGADASNISDAELNKLLESLHFLCAELLDAQERGEL